MCQRIFIIFILIFVKEVLCEKNLKKLSRQKRILPVVPPPPPFSPPLLFTQNAATGVLVAIGKYHKVRDFFFSKSSVEPHNGVLNAEYH